MRLYKVLQFLIEYNISILRLNTEKFTWKDILLRIKRFKRLEKTWKYEVLNELITTIFRIYDLEVGLDLLKIKNLSGTDPLKKPNKNLQSETNKR